MLPFFAPHLPAFASSAMSFSATPTLFMSLFIHFCYEAGFEGYPGHFSAETVSARCRVNRLTLTCCFCIDLYREVFLLFSLPCNINRRMK